MGFKYSVLGAGRQGVAIAYDLLRHGNADSVVLADSERSKVEEAAQRLNLITQRPLVNAVLCDAADTSSLRRAVRGSHAVVSALPYFFNLKALDAALNEGAHFSDLGGNTDIVLQELKTHERAVQAGLSVAPDCGLAPGLSNLMAARVLNKLSKTQSINVRCGGLPQRPRPPFHYKLVFSLHGLVNEYSGDAVVLREGKVQKIGALSEPEDVKIRGIGNFEAWVTTGGTSTAPYSFEGKVKNFDYKTLRYPGHFAAFKAFSDLGLFDSQKKKVGDIEIAPRDLFTSLLLPKIDFQADRDLVILLVDAEGTLKGKKKKYRALLVDKGDPKTSFTAMERTTGFPTAVIAYLQASGNMPLGALPIEKSVPLDLFFKELATRGLSISETLR